MLHDSKEVGPHRCPSPLPRNPRRNTRMTGRGVTSYPLPFSSELSKIASIPCRFFSTRFLARRSSLKVCFFGGYPGIGCGLGIRTLQYSWFLISSVTRSCFLSIVTDQIGSRSCTGESHRFPCFCGFSSTGSFFAAFSLDVLHSTISRGRCY